MLGQLKPSLVMMGACGALFVASMADARPAHPSHHPDPITLSASCRTPRTEIVTTDEPAWAIQTDFVTISNGTISFKSRRTGCIIVTFSAATHAESDSVAGQMVLDGTDVCGPAYGMEPASMLAGPESSLRAVSMTYLRKDVPPGDHTVEAQFATAAGAEADFMGHTFTVAHN